MEYRRSVIELIRSRTSVRSFLADPLPQQAREVLERGCLSLTHGPLGTECRFRLLDGSSIGWTLWGASAFLAGAARQAPHALEDYGFLFEMLILLAADLGLGTCWLGATFPRGLFASALKLERNELLPAVSPAGIPSSRSSAYDRLAKLVVGARKRKSWSELFFDGDFGAPLSETSPGLGPAYAQALEMVRLAPSAQNRQPWRILRTRETGLSGSVFHFFRRHPSGPLASRSNWLRLDIGIAMAHFELTLAEAGIRGRWICRESAPTALLPRTDYAASWIEETGS